MNTKLKLIFLIFIFLILCGSAFLIGKAIFTGETISDKDKSDYSPATMESPSDKDLDCFTLKNGKTACKVGTFEIESGEIREID